MRKNHYFLSTMKMADFLLVRFSCRARRHSQHLPFHLIDRFHVLTAAFDWNFRMPTDSKYMWKLHFHGQGERLAALKPITYTRILEIFDLINSILLSSKTRAICFSCWFLASCCPTNSHSCTRYAAWRQVLLCDWFGHGLSCRSRKPEITKMHRSIGNALN